MVAGQWADVMIALGSIDYRELFHPRPRGEPVNVHVVPAVPVPVPDYADMQRFIESAVIGVFEAAEAMPHPRPADARP